VSLLMYEGTTTWNSHPLTTFIEFVLYYWLSLIRPFGTTPTMTPTVPLIIMYQLNSCYIIGLV